ncbi:ferredoxin [Deinococcus sp.]|uniref:ferredoxin n=1 Tax=Deinococcus sp. TaxID=47478 RepID=UPI00286DD9BD|nr:ferredoxin [Deinococcus sp.]
MPHVIVSPCIGVKDQSCTEVCPVECIYDAGEMYLIHPDECIDCGACVPACPVSAIYPEEDTPASETEYIQKNRAFFGL